MNVNLGPVFERFVDELVKSGLYQSNSEVVREGLRMLQERQQIRQLRLEELRREVQVGIDDLARGDRVTADEVFAELAQMSAQRRKGRGK